MKKQEKIIREKIGMIDLSHLYLTRHLKDCEKMIDLRIGLLN